MSEKPIYHQSAKDIEVSIWNNKITSNGKTYDVKTITIHKNYVKNNVCQRTTSYKIGDIPKLMICLDAVYKKFMLNSDLKEEVADELENNS